MENMIKYLKDQTIFFEKLAVNDDFLFEELNKLKNSDQLNVISDEYQNSINEPVNLLRLMVCKALKNGENVTKDFVDNAKNLIVNRNANFLLKYFDNDIVEKIKNSDIKERAFQSWGRNFGILYPFFYYGTVKKNILNNLKEFAKIVIEKLELKDYIDLITGFDGARSQGQSNVYFRVLPKNLQKNNDAIYFYFEFYNGIFEAGVLRSQKSNSDLEIPNKFKGKEFEDINAALEHLKIGKEFVLRENENIALNVDKKTNKQKYWVIAAGKDGCEWDDFKNNSIIAIGWEELGDLREYNKDEVKNHFNEIYGKNSNFDILAVWQFVNEMQIGDVVYAKKGTKTLLGRGKIISDYMYNDNREKYNNIRQVKWTDINKIELELENIEKVHRKTLTEITSQTGKIEKIENLFGKEVGEENGNFDLENYTKENFLKEVFIEKEKYDMLESLLLNKKNLILQGAPGVGKTFAAKRLAYSILGKKDEAKIKIIQFHQNYGYEYFIMGYKPSKDGFELVKGAFYEFCKKAESDKHNKYFFIIDEINRGKLSKIFGELLMLIETDKRGEKLRLMYEDEEFSVPKNLHIIGMMNTADRSLAMIDYALRRRFAFYNFEPAFNTDAFKKYQEKINNKKYDALIEVIKKLNEEIKKDISLGDGFQIGHSYFCKNNEDDVVDDEWLSSVVEYEIIPLLEEYWFDNQDNVKEWKNKLKNAIGNI